MDDILNDAMAPLAHELMLIDPADLIGLCLAEKHRNIGDLVESAAELLFTGQSLRYGGGAEVELAWDAAPAVVLDLEFEHEDMLVLFRLRLSAYPSVSEVVHVLDGSRGSRELAGPCLAQGLEASRLGALPN